MEGEAPRHVVEPELQFVAAANPTESLVDLPIVVDLLQAAGAVAEAGHSGDIGRAQSRRRAARIGIENPELLRDGAVLRARIGDSLEHARVTNAQVVAPRRSERSAIPQHRLLARHTDLA